MRVAVVLGATCGMRTNEICGLRWDRINRLQEMAEIYVKEVIAERPTRLKDRPKTPAGERKIPLTPEVQAILSEHAELYEKMFGKCVGHVVRFERSRFPFVAPTALAQAFRAILKAAGIVDERGVAKFSPHALRHYAASCWVMHNSTLGGIQQVARWLGHSDSSLTLRVYAHWIHDPEVQARFLRMPNWLAREVALPAPSSVPQIAPPAGTAAPFIAEIECPLPVPEHAAKWLKLVLVDLWQHGDLNAALQAQGKGRDTLRYELKRCGLPTAGEIEVMAWEALSGGAPAAPVVVQLEPECPIDLPDIASSSLRVFVRLLNSGKTGEAAAREVGQRPITISDELKRLKIAKSIGELATRLRHKRMMKLHGADYQTNEVAQLAGVSRSTVARLKRELKVSDPRGGRVGPAATKEGWAARKAGGSKALTNNDNLATPSTPVTHPKHKKQLKLL